ncbi:MAG: acyl-CoA dehydrogenase family protein [Gammaproteobacteria bacterium]
MPQASNSEITAEQFMDGLFGFIDKEVMPIQKQLGEHFTNPRLFWREDGRLSDINVQARRQVRMASARAGYYTAFCPTELGGMGLGAEIYYQTFEELSCRTGAPHTQLPMVTLAHTSTGPTALWMHVSERLKAEVLPALSRGELQGSFAMSEPDAGSDAWNMRTRAVRDGGDWILNGQKQWATWAPTADFVITFAITDPARFAARKGGLTCFFVPADAPGYRLESIVPVLGDIGGEECILSYTDLRIPDAYRIGPEGEGFPIAMQGSHGLKMTKLARSTGLARWAHAKALEWAKVRKTFGKPLTEHQTIQNMLAQNAIDIYTCRLMGMDLARKLDEGTHNRGEHAMADAFVFAAANRVIDRSMQIMGGMGMTNAGELFEGWKMTRIARITEGPTEIQMRMVARAVIGGQLAF